MSERRSFYRKIVYYMLIFVLLFPITQLGAPRTVDDEGGVLARLRYKHDLGQSKLGEIDPASETLRLATLGMRGVAVSMLWSKANEYKKTEDWTNFHATLEQLSNLQPYFISFWRYQAWNLTYNVSVELDDVRDRFYYVKQGIEFLKRGTHFNRDNPHLLAELGWFIGNKIGTADEKTEYRRMFRLDEDFLTRFFNGNPPPPEQRDNWLVSRGQYEKAVSAVDDKKESLGQKNPVTFYASTGMAQINYSDAIETEGIFGEKAKAAWAFAERLWNEYGNRELTSSQGFKIRLADLDRMEEETNLLTEELNGIAPEAKEELLAERRAKLTPEELEVLSLPHEKLTPAQEEIYHRVENTLNITPPEIAQHIVAKYPDKALQARKLASRIIEISSKFYLTRQNRDVSNFAYWRARTQMEQTPAALKAHELAYAAHRAFRDDADLLEAKRLYEESFSQWASVLPNYPDIEPDAATGSDIFDDIKRYNRVLEQMDLSFLDEEISEEFPLWEVLRANDNNREFADALARHDQKAEAEKPAEGN